MDDGYRDDDGKYFINLPDTGKFFNGVDWDDVQSDDENMRVSAWFDGETYFKSDSLKEIYNGAVLEAVWKNKEIAEPQVDNEIQNNIFGEGNPVIVEGLKENQTLKITNISSEEKERCDESVESFLASEGLGLEDNLEDSVVSLDIDIEGHQEGDEVRISVPIPEKLQDEDNPDSVKSSLKVLHFKKDGTWEFVKTEFVKGGQYIILVVDNFSPFYFVKTAAQENLEGKVKVTVENVDYGWINAYTRENEGYKFLPLDEEVELDVGTELHLEIQGYRVSGWHGQLKSLSLIPINGEGEGDPQPVDDFRGIYGSVQITQSCKLRAEFEKVPNEDSSHPQFSIYLRPDNIGRPTDVGGYEAEVRVSQYIDGEYRRISGWEVRMATVEDLEKASVNLSSGRYAAGMTAFAYNPATNKVTNVMPLNLGEYEIPFVITYGGNEYLVRREGLSWNDPYTAWVIVGANMQYRHGTVTFDSGKYDTFYGTYYFDMDTFAYDEGTTTWKDVNPSDEVMNNWYEGKPQMYNYEFAGWQDYTGRKYELDDPLVSPYGDDDLSFYAYDLFINSDGKKYAVEAKGVDVPMIDEENSSTSSRPSYGGGSGGGGTGSGSRSGLSSRDYTLHGTWVVDGNGWKFRTDSGAYATNTWGFINGKWYFFDANGRMVVGWYQVNGLWYFLTPEAGTNQGAMATGWRFDDSYKAWFYLNASGAMTTGWQQVNGLWYYLNPISDGTQGAMAANTTIDGYYVNSDGVWIP